MPERVLKLARIQTQTQNRRSFVLGIAILMSSATYGFARSSAPKLIILPKGAISPLRFTMRSPANPNKLVKLKNISVQGFLICNGADISRTDYKELFQVIGTRYGAGDAASTFALPNYPVGYRAGTPVNGMAICPSSRLGLPVSVIVPFDYGSQADAPPSPNAP